MASKKRSSSNSSSTAIKFWTPLRIVSTLIVLSLVAAFGVSSCNSNDPSTKFANLPAVPALVLDTEMKGASGNPIKLSKYNGKVLLVNLWATWCGPCQIETPELVKLYKEYQPRGVEFVGLSTEDPIASAQKVQDFVNRYSVGYTIGWAPREVALTLMQGRASIPQSFIITRNGRMLKRLNGFNPQHTPADLKQALDEALSGG